jgi:hypothetical protein
MGLDSPVISRDGDTLKITRGTHWGMEKSAYCLFLSVWIAFWSIAEYRAGKSLLFGIPDVKVPPGFFSWFWLVGWSCFGVLAISSWFRTVFLEGEVISVDSRGLQISRLWNGKWLTRSYPRHEIENLRRKSRWFRFGMLYGVQFQHQGKWVFLEPTGDEEEYLAMLAALQEHLTRQQVQ